MNDDLARVHHWCLENSLTINAKKTKVLGLTLNRNFRIKDHCNIILSNQNLEVVDSYKYLGVTLDTHLTYKPHIKNTINKVTHKLSLLTKIRKYVDVHTSLIIYKTMILPHFDYGDVIYAAGSQENLNELQKLQNKCLRICTKAPLDINIDRLHSLSKLSKLEKRRNTHLLNLMYSRKNDEAYIDNRPIPTRQHTSITFKIPFSDKTTVQKSVLIRGANAWNILPDNIRDLPSKDEFKKYTRSLLINI